MAFVLLCWVAMTGCQNQAPAPNSAQPHAAAAPRAAAADTNAVPAESLVRQVVFDPLGVGKDPFFPRTVRQPQDPAETNDAVVVAVRPVLPPSSYLKLTGLWPVPPRPLAFINKTDFRPGEEAAVTIVFTNGQNLTESQKVLVRCLEIRRDSVLVSVEGESGTKELRMP